MVRSNLYRTVDAKLAGGFAAWLAPRRQTTPPASWERIAQLILEETGVIVTGTTVAQWADKTREATGA